MKLKSGGFPKGLVSYWTMDNVSGNTLIDEKGINNGTIYGATQVDGKIGKALSFDGVDDYVSIANSNSTNFGANQSFTYTAWVRQDSSQRGWRGFIYHGLSSQSQGHLGLNPTRKLSGGTGNSIIWDTRETTYTLPLNEWVFISMTLDRDTNILRFYANGTEVGNFTSYTAVPSTSTTAALTFGQGSTASTETLHGKMDEVMIFNRALSLEEINKLYNSGLGKYKPLNNNLVNVKKLDSSSLVGYWTMDEINGTTLIDKMGVNNGTIYGATQVEGKIGKALSFDGVDDKVLVENLQGDLTNFTISHWFKSSSNSGVTLDNYVGDSGTLFVLPSSTKLSVAVFATSANIYYNKNLLDDEWHNIIITYNGTTAYLLVDGEIRDSKSFSGTLSKVKFGIGYQPQTNNFNFNGLIDEVMIFNKALSIDEISYLYNSGKGKYSPIR